jgi:hypothetical protein
VLDFDCRPHRSGAESSQRNCLRSGTRLGVGFGFSEATQLLRRHGRSAINEFAARTAFGERSAKASDLVLTSRSRIFLGCVDMALVNSTGLRRDDAARRIRHLLPAVQKLVLKVPFNFCESPRRLSTV